MHTTSTSKRHISIPTSNVSPTSNNHLVSNYLDSLVTNGFTKSIKLYTEDTTPDAFGTELSTTNYNPSILNDPPQMNACLSSKTRNTTSSSLPTSTTSWLPPNPSTTSLGSLANSTKTGKLAI